MPALTPAYQESAYVSQVASAITQRIRELDLDHRGVAQRCGVDRQVAQRALRGHHVSGRNQDALLTGLGLVVRAASETSV